MDGVIGAGPKGRRMAGDMVQIAQNYDKGARWHCIVVGRCRFSSIIKDMMSI